MKKFMILNETDEYLISISKVIPFFTKDPKKAQVYDTKSANRMIEYGTLQGRVWTKEETTGG